MLPARAHCVRYLHNLASLPPLPLCSVQTATAGLPGSVKVDAYKQVKPGVWEWWSSCSLQLNTEREPEIVSSGSASDAAGVGVSAGGACMGAGAPAADENRPRQASGTTCCNGSSDCAGGAGKAAVVKGKRYRLLPPAEGQQRALPAVGKVAVLFGGHTCEAQLSLPASDTR